MPEKKFRFMIEVVSVMPLEEVAGDIMDALRSELPASTVTVQQAEELLHFPTMMEPISPPRSLIDELLSEENVERIVSLARRIRA